MKSVIATHAAPAAIGPYSQAVRFGNLLFCSGQIPLDPETGALVEGSIQTETTRVLDNLKAVLEAAGCELGDVLKTTIFLQSMSDFAAVNEVYAGYFPTSPPARSTVAVAGLPKGVRVEIEAIAHVKTA